MAVDVEKINQAVLDSGQVEEPEADDEDNFMEDFEKLLEPTVDIPDRLGGTVTFTFKKMMPLDAWKLFDAMRPSIAGVLGKFPEDLKAPGAAGQVAAAIGEFPPMVLEAIRSELFKFVKYQSATTQSPNTLFGDENSAFQNLEPVIIYEVIVRAFLVNFFESFLALESRFPIVAELRQPNSPT